MTIDRSKFEMRQRRMPEHMSNLDKLVPASFRNAKFAVLTISDAVIVDARRGNDPRTGKAQFEPAVVLRFVEFPNRIFWVNTIGVNILADQYGDEEAEWVGKKVPLKVQENVRNPSEGGTNDMLWVANADEWDSLFQQDADARTKKKVDSGATFSSDVSPAKPPTA